MYVVYDTEPLACFSNLDVAKKSIALSTEKLGKVSFTMDDAGQHWIASLGGLAIKKVHNYTMIEHL